MEDHPIGNRLFGRGAVLVAGYVPFSADRIIHACADRAESHPGHGVTDNNPHVDPDAHARTYQHVHAEALGYTENNDADVDSYIDCYADA